MRSPDIIQSPFERISNYSISFVTSTKGLQSTLQWSIEANGENPLRPALHSNYNIII